MDVSRVFQEHGLVYVFNLTIKEAISTFVLIWGKEDVLSINSVCVAQNYLH